MHVSYAGGIEARIVTIFCWTTENRSFMVTKNQSQPTTVPDIAADNNSLILENRTQVLRIFGIMHPSNITVDPVQGDGESAANPRKYTRQGAPGPDACPTTH